MLLSSIGFIAILILGFNKKPFSSLYIYSCILILVEYIFAINGKLYVGYQILLIVGILLVAPSTYLYIKIKSQKLQYSSLLILIPFIFYLTAIPETYFFTTQDEFAWWGASINYISENDKLVNTDFHPGHRHYPPGQQLIQYYFIKSTFWSEANALRAQNILILCAILYTVSEISKNTKLIPVSFIIASSSLYAFQFGFTTIMNDALLAASFAAAIASSINYRKDWASHLKMGLCALVLILLKDVGIVLAALALIIYLFNIYIYERRVQTRSLSAIRATMVIFIIFLLIYLLKSSWVIYVTNINSTVEIKHLSLQTLLNGEIPKNTEAVIEEFLRRINSNIFFDLKFFKLSTGWTTLILIFISIYVIHIGPRNLQSKSYLALLVFLIGLVLYILIHIYLYIVWFGDYEGIRLASFERYIGVYYLAWLIFIITFSVERVGRISYIHTKNYTRQIRILVLFISMVGGAFLHIKHISPSLDLVKVRQELLLASENMKKYISKDQKIYFIMQNSQGYEQSLFKYIMKPYNGGNACWSIGKKYYIDDVWTCEKKLQDLIVDYDFIYVYRGDQQFWSANKLLFDDTDIAKNSVIFKIVKKQRNLISNDIVSVRLIRMND